MRILSLFIFVIAFAINLHGQSSSLAAIYERSDDTVSYLLFDQNESAFSMNYAWLARSYDLAQSHPDLTVSGDFTGNGVSELAVFNDLEYTPTLNPFFTSSVVTVNRSGGKEFIPSGSWFSIPDTLLDFDFVTFSVAGDYTGDGLDDICIFLQ